MAFKIKAMPLFSSFTSGYIFKRTDSRVPRRYLNTHIPNSITPNSQKVEEIQVTTMDEWLHKVWFRHTSCYCTSLK